MIHLLVLQPWAFQACRPTHLSYHRWPMLMLMFFFGENIEISDDRCVIRMETLGKKDVGLIFLKCQAISTFSIQLHPFPYLGPSWTYWPCRPPALWVRPAYLWVSLGTCRPWMVPGQRWCRNLFRPPPPAPLAPAARMSRVSPRATPVPPREGAQKNRKSGPERWNWAMWSCSVHLFGKSIQEV